MAMHGLLSLNCNTPAVEAHRLIDEAIKRPGANVLALKSQRNTFAPISHLPAEVLCEIFFNTKEKEPTLSLACVKLTHVCQHWRDIGIGSSSLWTGLPLRYLRSLPLMELMLARSKQSPLVIKTDIEWSSNYSVLKKSLEHFQRVEDLTLYLNVETHWVEFQNFFTKSAPKLKKFCVLLETRSPVHFLSTELVRDTPQLRHLELKGFEFNWKTHSHLLHALTHLSLNHILFSGLMWNQFAEALKGMPDLEVLSLLEAIPSVADNVQVSWTPVHFASLRNLFLSCSDKKAQIFLSCFTFPPTTKTCIGCSVASQRDIDFSVIFAKLGKIYSCLPTDGHYKTLIIIEPHLYIPGLHLKLFVDDFFEERLLHRDFKAKQVPADLEFALTWFPSHINDEIATKAWNDLFNSGLPLQSIGHIYLTDPVPYVLDPPIFADTIGKLSQPLSFLTTGKAAKTFVEALLQPETIVEGANKPTLFPNLTSIFLHKAKFRVPDLREPESALPFASLRNCLTERAKRGAKLDRLVLMYCNKVFKADVDSLAAAVKKIDYDSQDIHLGVELDGEAQYSVGNSFPDEYPNLLEVRKLGRGRRKLSNNPSPNGMK